MNPTSNIEWVVYWLCLVLIVIAVGALIFGYPNVYPLGRFIV